MDRDVHICETGLRDSFQNLPNLVPTQAKRELIGATAAAGVPEIDAASFVPPKVLPQLMATRAILARHVEARLLTGHLHEAGIPKALRRAA